MIDGEKHCFHGLDASLSHYRTTSFGLISFMYHMEASEDYLTVQFGLHFIRPSNVLRIQNGVNVTLRKPKKTRVCRWRGQSLPNRSANFIVISIVGLELLFGLEKFGRRFDKGCLRKFSEWEVQLGMILLRPSPWRKRKQSWHTWSTIKASKGSATREQFVKSIKIYQKLFEFVFCFFYKNVKRGLLIVSFFHCCCNQKLRKKMKENEGTWSCYQSTN